MNRSGVRVRAALVIAMLSFALPGVALAAKARAKPAAAAAKPAATAPAKDAKPARAKEDIAIFAGGCFWCMETDFEERPGIKEVISGYTGGTEVNPTYEEVSSHMTHHRESVEIHFDPSVVSYEKLVDIYWHSIDPTQDDGQFCDRGDSYRSAIFYRNAEQKAVAEKSKHDIEASGVLKKPIVTELLPASKFWPAEDYHQDFWKKDPIRYRSYRFGCGRDQRLVEIWGKDAAKPSVH